MFTCSLNELNRVFSLFLIMYSVGNNHLCSWHSSADGRLLEKSLKDQINCYIVITSQ